MKRQFIFLLIASLFFNLALTKTNKKSKKLSQDVAKGAIRLGDPSANILIPDAGAEHPLVFSNVDQQPLCLPNKTIPSATKLKAMIGYEFFVLTNQVEDPKKMVMDKANHLLVISPNNGLYSIRMDKCGNPGIVQILEMNALDEPLGTGFALYDRYIYIISTNSVYRFNYSDGQHSPLKEKVKVLSNINPTGLTESSDIAIDLFGQAFIPRTVTEVNITTDASHAIIKKFNFHTIPASGYDFQQDGKVFVNGTNTQGLLALDAQSQLWGINGLSHIGDPSGYSEELNQYSAQKNHGFPYCLTKHNSTVTQEEHPVFAQVLANDYCQNLNSNVPPAIPLVPASASSALFYTGAFCSMGDQRTQGTSVGLPCTWTNTPMIANHGWEGEPAGHNVVHLPFRDLVHEPRLDKKVDVLLEQTLPCRTQACFSPFGLAFDSYGRLFVSSDETNEIVVLRRTFSATAAQALTDSAEKPEKEESKKKKSTKKDTNEED